MSGVGNLAIAERAPIYPPAGQVVPVAPPAAPAPAHGARARRASGTREAHDGWTFVMIPPGVGARPRTLRISVRRLRFVGVMMGTLAGTAVVSGSLLAVLLSMAPTIQPETAGVRLGVFADDSIAFGATATDSSAARSIFNTPLGLGAAAGAAMGAATGSPPATRAATAKQPNRPSASSRRVIAPPSVSGRRSAASDAASVAEARAHGLPVIGRITSRFSNARTHPMLGVVRKHNGVDIAAPQGTPITAAAAGRVIFAGRKFGFGNTVEIDHGNGVVTRYAHARTIKVRGGARVESGATIATVGRTGLASGPHLHFEVLVNGTSVDPLRRPVKSLLAPPAETESGAADGVQDDGAAASAPSAPPALPANADSLTGRDAAGATDDQLTDVINEQSAAPDAQSAPVESSGSRG